MIYASCRRRRGDVEREPCMTDADSVTSVIESPGRAAESAAQPDERLISIELDSELNETLQREYRRLASGRNPSMSFSNFILVAIHVGLDRLRDMPAEKVLDLLADSEPAG